MLTLAVLGPVAVRRDGALLRVPGGKTMELLVRLALEAGDPIRSERLLEDLWPGLPQGASRNTLQSKASRLRAALGVPGVLHGDESGYTLRVDPDGVDALRVLRLTELAGSLRADGEPAATLLLCEQGLASFHGDVLPGATDAPWAEPYRARLESARLELTEGRLAARAAMGAAGELVGELEELVTAHPLRESLWVLLVTALYRAGRQGDALAASARVRRRLADALGVDPGPELRALELQVLHQDPGLLASRATTVMPAPPADGNLPLVTGALIGREREVDQLVELLAARRLVTVTGPAGVGKSRLALESVQVVSPPGGAWLARLETATDTATVWQRLGEALRIDAPTPSSVSDRLAHAEAVVILDGCEHVVGAVGEALTVLLSGAPRVRFVATSQVPLHVSAEVVLDVRPLGIADSVALFADRAVTRRADQRDEAETRRTVEEVCRSLDGLPLAIELAAARTRILPLAEIARRLEDRFALLRDPTSPLPMRQSTLLAALTWSYDLLFPDDQRGLWALGTFTGGASLSAVEEVLVALDVPRGAALDVVARLVDRSLVIADLGSPGGARYRLLDSVRALSRARLRDAGLCDQAAGAHAAWFADAAERARTGARGPAQPEHLAVARAERANIDAALAWCATHAPDVGLRIALGLGWTWVVLGTGVEGARAVRAALDAADASDEDTAWALTLCGWFEASGGSLDRAVEDLSTAIAIGDAPGRATARLHLAFVHTQAGRAADALAVLTACRPEQQRLGQVWEEGAGWLLEAWAHLASGRPAEGRAACDRALEILRPLGDAWALAHAEGLLGELAGVEHRYADATAHLVNAAAAAATLGFEAAHAHHLLNLGLAQQATGDARAGRETLQQALEVSARCGDLRTAAHARAHLAQSFRVAGEAAAAMDLAHRAADMFADLGGGDGARLAGYLIAALHADAGSAGAREDLERVAEAARHAGDSEVQVLALDALALVDATAGRDDRARELTGEADALATSALFRWAGRRIDRERARDLLDRGSPTM